MAAYNQSNSEKIYQKQNNQITHRLGRKYNKKRTFQYTVGAIVSAFMQSSLGQENHADSTLTHANHFKKYELTAQGLEYENSIHGYKVVKGIITLSTPDGDHKDYTFRSGGFGWAKDNSALPGLIQDNLPHSPLNGTYELDYSSFVVDTSSLQESMKGKDGVGSWLRLLADRKQTNRGAAKGDLKNFFGIHTDGPSVKNGRLNDGSHGCLVLPAAHAREILAEIRSLPKNMRPEKLKILPPLMEEKQRFTQNILRTTNSPQPSI